MARSFMWWFLAVVLLAFDLWATFVWLPGRSVRAASELEPPAVTAAATPARPGVTEPNEVDRVILRKLERGELSCVNGYVSALRVENGVARAYVIQTDKGPARCATTNRQGRQTSL